MSSHNWRLTGAAAAIVSVASLASGAPAPEQLIREFVAAFNAHDVRRMLASCADDVAWMSISGADVSVTIHARLLQPVLDMLVLFLGLPVVLSRESRNAFIAVGSCLLIVTVFVIVSLALRSMGMNYIISPSLAVWLPLMIFVPLAVLIGGPLRR